MPASMLRAPTAFPSGPSDTCVVVPSRVAIARHLAEARVEAVLSTVNATDAARRAVLALFVTNALALFI